MKNHVCCVLISGAVVAASAHGATATQPGAAKPEAQLSRAQISALVKADLNTCSSKVPAVPQGSVRTISPERVAKTLHGVWRGRVWGDYPKELLAKDGYLNVDYYWIIDTKHGEALILEQLSSKRAAPRPAAAGAPAWSFLTCGREGYVPRHPRQVHEFQKISNTLEGARRMLETSTGLKVLDQQLSLSAAWKRLVETKYFDTKRFKAFAGGLFTPLAISSSKTAAGAPIVSLSYRAEYRGVGETAARFEVGQPILGKESAGFIGVSTPSGDYLVSSPENGIAWAKGDDAGARINIEMDKVVIGPLAQ